jgi:hypothetical protein
LLKHLCCAAGMFSFSKWQHHVNDQFHQFIMVLDTVNGAVQNFAFRILDCFTKELQMSLPENLANQVQDHLNAFKQQARANAAAMKIKRGVKAPSAKKEPGAAAAPAFRQQPTHILHGGPGNLAVAQPGGIQHAGVAKRSPNRWNIYQRDKIQELSRKNPGVKKVDIMKEVSNMWKAERQKHMMH